MRYRPSPRDFARQLSRGGRLIAPRGLQEIGYLHASIGRTGLLVLKPLQVTSARDQWHRYLLAAADTPARLTRAPRGR